MATQPQPNFEQLKQHLVGISHEIGLMPNMPALAGIENLVNTLRDQQARALAQQAQEHGATLAQQARQHAEDLRLRTEQHAEDLRQRTEQHAEDLRLRAEQHQQLITRLDAIQATYVSHIFHRG